MSTDYEEEGLLRLSPGTGAGLLRSEARIEEHKRAIWVGEIGKDSRIAELYKARSPPSPNLRSAKKVVDHPQYGFPRAV